MSRSSAPPSDALAAAFAYHERTKHDYGRYARSAGFMDWATQPDPFRRYDGAELVPLELPTPPAVSYEQLYHPGTVPPAALDPVGLSRWLYHSLALSAWKSIEDARWSLRVNPSSGNLHPTEAYVLLPGEAGLEDAPGLYHYAPREHGLERRARMAGPAWSVLTAGLPEGAFFVALSSIPWRESWKYGERAYRYCQHDVGHALAALRYGAALLGWRLAVLPDVPDARLATLLGLDRLDEFVAQEAEVPDLLAVVLTGPAGAASVCSDFVPTEEAASAVSRSEWSGRANRLSPGHQDWSVIGEVERACRKREGGASLALAPGNPTSPLPLDEDDDVPNAASILRGRRSAVAMDGQTGITADAFFTMLSRTVPGRSAVPWDAVTWPTWIHLGLFIHRVADLAPGLYVLARRADAVDELRAAMNSDFAWTRPEGCPDDLELYLLKEADARSVAAAVSCGQDIAADGAFSLGMLAEYEAPLKSRGAPAYRHLFWETGVLGQVLYLEAEAAGIRATGIGCFFDDPVHRTFGLEGRAYQSLYHFTVGGPVDDARLATEPAYSPDR